VYYQLTRQLQHLTQILIQIKKGNLSRRCHVPSINKKLNRLTMVLNEWLDEVQDKMLRLEELKKEYQEILSHLSHDLRTPLTSLLGYTEVLKDEEHEMNVEDKIAYLEIIYQKAEKIHTLLSRFFELARLESEEGAFHREVFNIVNIIHEVMLLFYQKVESEQIQVKLDIPDAFVQVKGNLDATERILMNLISNAIRYGGSGGILEIRMTKEENKVWIHVRDEGKGISPKDIPHIFHRLYTGSKARKEGTGLGLTITKKLVEKQGKEIRVESIPGMKTIFSFFIPVN
jgi:signal transduction histidine kinase